MIVVDSLKSLETCARIGEFMNGETYMSTNHRTPVDYAVTAVEGDSACDTDARWAY